MADIPVQRKKAGTPWWIYVLGLLALLLIMGVALRGCTRAVGDGDNESDGRPRISTEGVGTTTGSRVTDPNLFGSTADKLSLVGREAELENVTVSRVLSDRVFTVTAGQGEMFVMLADRLNSGPAEAAVQVRAGEIVNLDGTFRRVDGSDTKDEQGRGLDAAEYRQMAGQQIFLMATSARNAD